MKVLLNHSILIFIGLLLSASLTAQESKIDSLESVLKQKIHDTVRIQVVFELASEFKDKDINKSITYSNQLLSLSQKRNDKTNMSKAYDLLALGLYQKDYQIDTVIAVYKKSLGLANAVNNTHLKLKALSGMARTYGKFGLKDKAISLHQEVLKKAEATNDKLTIITASCDLGNLLRYGNETEQLAKKYYFKALKYSEELNEQDFILINKGAIASIYHIEGKLDSALVLAKEVLKQSEEMNHIHSQITMLNGIGIIYTNKLEYQKAAFYLQKGYELSLEINNTSNAVISLYNLSSVYRNQKEHVKAIEALKKCLELQNESMDLMIKKSLYLNLSTDYEYLKNSDLALENYKLYHQLNDSINDIGRNKQIEELKTIYGTQQKEAENQLLKAETEVANRKTRNTTFTVIGLVIILLLVIGWSSFIYKANQEKKRLNEVLEAKVKERTKDLEQANYELRTFNYIASHDIKEPIRNIGNYAGLIFRKLPDDLKESLGEYFDIIKRGTTQLYTLIEDFASYTTLSHGAAINKQSVDLDMLTVNIVSSFEETVDKYNGTITFSNLPTIESNNSLLFTTLKNLIENGLKYNNSEKPTVNIDYLKTENAHQIIVSDNGIGIEKIYHEKVFEMFKRLHNRGEYEGSGIGLAIVKLSVKKLDGTVLLESEEGKGSRFIIELPIV